MHFRIDQWRAWAPGLDSTDDWLVWSSAPGRLHDTGEQPDVGFLPAMQRRRLSRLARMVFQVAWPLAEGHPALPLVFASRHGETPRSLSILQDLARAEPLSPTQFSLSVHNAIIGQWSILRGDTSEMTALAGEGDGLEMAMLEAATLLADGAPAVLLVIGEEAQPELYMPFIDDVPFPYALALLLMPGEDWHLQLRTGSGPRAPWPHPLSLIQGLCNGYVTLEHTWKERQWTWSRKSL
ncbi:Beta-ketoacyl synthase, N-terminal domain [Pseudomonas flavescens]|uniref:Beta-ketoacyl synthase, N-terminal domain n=1 Tax=Phytopseudomonas flavescens TaxID=29435 RepID=A0A1G8EBJ2_9GAMM|nr:beta-ketoacyl synthase chain length factor [Pseudomonas flavescens]SDH67302.1 Beta-ketoacyl synthase, N-terminal domain [Pseudomonas flavescens]